MLLRVGVVLLLCATVASSLRGMPPTRSGASRRPASAAGGCPIYPFLQPVTLPSPLPARVTAALAAANATLYSALDPVAIPGFAFAVWHEGNVVASWGAGVANKSRGLPPDPDASLFRVASNTKIFTTLLLFIFVEAGYCALDDPVSKYVPGFKVYNQYDSNEITLRMLASHSAGLPDSLPGVDDWTNVTSDQIWAELAQMPLQAPLSGRPNYSNLGIAVLGHVLAEYVAPASERGDVGALLQKYIWSPLGLQNTGYYYPPSVVARMATGYSPDGSPAALDYLGWEAPAGVTYSTVMDLGRFHQAILAVARGKEGGPLAISPARVREWMQPTYQLADWSLQVGLPWEIVPFGGLTVRTKSGTLTGYATKSALLPELGLSFAFTFNGNFQPWAAGDQLLRTVIAKMVPGFEDAIVALQPTYNPGPKPNDFVGSYVQTEFTSNIITITLDSSTNQLMMALPGFGTGVLDWVPGAPKDSYQYSMDPTADPCEMSFFEDTPVGWPVVFTRDGTDKVASLSIVNYNGSWSKQ